MGKGFLRLILDRKLAEKGEEVHEEEQITELEYDDRVHDAISRRIMGIHELRTEILNFQRYYLRKERYKQYPNLVVEYFSGTDGAAYCRPRETTMGFNPMEMTNGD